MSVHILRSAPVSWGDYGGVLVHGLSRRRERIAGVMQLERAGPFVPPITFPTPAEVVVTSAFRERLERAAFTGLIFQRIDVVTAVDLPWEEWDRTRPRPAVMPPSGEPEDYLPTAMHSSACAAKIGRLWEFAAPGSAVGTRVNIGFRKYSYKVAVRADAPDFFRAEGLGFTFVSDRARAWLAKVASAWVAFETIAQN